MITINLSKYEDVIVIALVILVVLLGASLGMLSNYIGRKRIGICQGKDKSEIIYDDQGCIHVINTDANGNKQIYVTDSDGNVRVTQTIKGNRNCNIVQAAGAVRNKKGVKTVISQSIVGSGNSNIVQVAGDVRV